MDWSTWTVNEIWKITKSWNITKQINEDNQINESVVLEEKIRTIWHLIETIQIEQFKRTVESG